MLLRFLKKVNINVGLFSDHYVDVKVFYSLKFNAIPNIIYIADVDSTKAYKFIKESFYKDIISVHQHCYFNHIEKEVYFNNTIVVLNFDRMIEITTDHCQLFFPVDKSKWARDLVNELAQFGIERNIVPAFRHTQIVGFAKEAEVN